MNVTLTPMPGRDYTSAKKALASYHAGADFIIQHFSLPARPINKQQCEAEHFAVTLRYANLRKTVCV